MEETISRIISNEFSTKLERRNEYRDIVLNSILSQDELEVSYKIKILQMRMGYQKFVD